MPVTTTIRVEGLQQLGERMRGLARTVNVKIARASTNAAAQVIKKGAKQKAPVAPPEVTPKVPYASLKNNVVVKRIAPSKTPLTSEHIVTIRGKKKDFYAHKVGRLNEFGTVKQAAKPWMRPAFEENKGKALEALVQKLKDGISKASK